MPCRDKALKSIRTVSIFCNTCYCVELYIFNKLSVMLQSNALCMIYIVAFIPRGRKYERKCGIISTSIIGSPLKPIRLCVYIFSFPVSLFFLSLSLPLTHRYIQMSPSKSHKGHYLCKKRSENADAT